MCSHVGIMFDWEANKQQLLQGHVSYSVGIFFILTGKVSNEYTLCTRSKLRIILVYRDPPIVLLTREMPI